MNPSKLFRQLKNRPFSTGEHTIRFSEKGAALSEYAILVALLAAVITPVALSLGSSITSFYDTTADAIVSKNTLSPGEGTVQVPRFSILDFQPRLVSMPSSGGHYTFSFFTPSNPPPPGYDPSVEWLLITRTRNPAPGSEMVPLTAATSVGEGGRFTVMVFNDTNPPPPSIGWVGNHWVAITDSATGGGFRIDLN